MSTHMDVVERLGGEVNHPVPAETWNALFKYYHRTKLACIGLSAALICTTFGWLVHPITVVKHVYIPQLDKGWLAVTKQAWDRVKSNNGIWSLKDDYIDKYPAEYRAAVEQEQ